MRGASPHFSYGYLRFKDMGGFLTSMTVISATFFILMDVLNHFLEHGHDEEITWKSSRVLFYHFIALIIVDFIGILIFYGLLTDSHPFIVLRPPYNLTLYVYRFAFLETVYISERRFRK